MKTLIALSFLFACSATPQNTNPQRLLLLNCTDKVELLFQIPATRAEALPKWHPESDVAPPVSLKRACALAKAALKERRPELDELEVDEVAISEIRWTTRPGSWFYTVRCFAKKDGKPAPPCTLITIILMDGTSVEPIITRKEQPPTQ